MEVEWRVRSLAAFEHQPLHKAAQSCDLLIFDHPFCGVIAATRCLRQLPDSIAAAWGNSAAFVGPSLESYRFDAALWGVPVDGACNHAAYRVDLMPDGAVPQDWSAVVALGHAVAGAGRKLAIAAAGHHGLLAVAALCANLGQPLPTESRAQFAPDADALSTAIEALREVLALSPPESLGWNSVALHDAMTSRDDLVYCPIVFGFAAYGESVPMLSFGPLPGLRAPFHRGSVLGGAAIGLSRACSDQSAALDFMSFLAEPRTQTDILAANAGQPARVAAWRDSPRHGNYFAAVRSTLEAAQIRPRFVGYQQFEARAGDRLEAMLRDRAPTRRIVAMIGEEADRVRRGMIDPPYDRLAANATQQENTP